MGFGRENAICEYIEIMQIPPRFERRSAPYKGMAAILQYAGCRNAPSELEIQKFQPLPHAEQRDCKRKCRESRPRAVGPPLHESAPLRGAAIFAIPKQLRHVRNSERDSQG